MLKIVQAILLLTNLIFTQTEQRISKLNLLLPLSKTTQITYNLKAYNGCYKWSSSNPKIFSLTPYKTDKAGCVSEITVKVETLEEYENIVWISAEDLRTNEILNCEARVAPLKKLEIVTKQKSILVGDFETLELMGYDLKGNGFTSLEGLIFNWKIEQQNHLAEFLSFRESLVKTSQKRHLIEDQGLKTDMVILRGIETGGVKIFVGIDDRFYDDIFGQDNLFIIEHFVVFPENTVFLMPGEKIKYSLFKIKKKNKKMDLVKIDLPNKKYKWELSNTNIGQFRNSILKIGEKTGSSYLTVYDVLNPNNKITNKVVVTEPRSLNLFVTRYTQQMKNFLNNKTKNFFGHNLLDHNQFTNNWNLLLGEEYIIKGVLFDENGNEITIQDFFINFNLDSDFKILLKSNNYIIIKTLGINEKDKIEAEFKTSSPKSVYKNIFKQYSILSKLKIIKSKTNLILLPFKKNLKNTESQQTYKLKTLGGSSKIKYISKNPDIAIVSSNGIISIKKPGQTKIEAIDIKNKNNLDFVNLEIIEIKDIEFLEKKKEGRLFKENNIFIRAFDNKNRFFNNCTSIVYNFKAEDLGDYKIENNYNKICNEVDLFMNGFDFAFKEFDGIDDYDKSDYSFYVENDLVKEEDLEIILKNYRNYGICSFINIQPKKNGLFQMEIGLDEKKPKISEFKVVDEYKVEYPEKYDETVFGKDVILAPGTSVLFKLKGGPQGWNNNHLVNHRIYQIKKTKKYFETKIIEKNNNIYVEIKCDGKKNYERLEKGEIEIISSNKKDKDLISPVSIIAKLKIICGNPSEVEILSEDNLKSNGFNALKNKQKNFSFRNNRDHKLIFWAYDNLGNPFWNITSINSEMTLQNKKIGDITKLEKNKYNLNLNNESDNSDLNIIVNSYKDSNKKFSNLKDRIKISSFDVLAIEPKYNIVYLHPDNNIILKIINGSGNFDITTDTNFLVKTNYFSERREIFVSPLNEGKVKIFVRDKNLNSTPAEAEIKVVRVDRIFLNFENSMVSLGDTVEGEIQIFSGDEEIPKDQMKYINLEVLSSNPNAKIDLKNNKVSLKPEEIGSYVLSVNSKADRLTSNLVELNVFGDINVFPKNIYLTKGCKTTFKVLGGPSSILRQRYGYEILIKDITRYSNIKKIDDNIYSFEAEENFEGYLTIQLKSSLTKKIISETKIFILVQKISGFQVIGTNELWKGATSRVFAIPQIRLNSITPSNCEIKYHIINNSPEILQSPKGYLNLETNDIKFDKLSIWAFNIKGLTPGRANLEIELMTKYEKKKGSLEINVVNSTEFDNSRVIGKKCNCNGNLLLTPSSSLKIDIDNYYSYTELILKEVDNCSKLTQPNILSTNEKVGVDVLIVKKNGVLEKVQSILVSNPAFMIVENSEKMTFANTHSNINMKVLFLDKFGQVFSNSKNNLSIQFMNSNPDIVSLFFDKNSNELVINTKNKGKAVIYIKSEKYPNLFDIFTIRVGPMIKPEGNLTIHLGSTIKFEALREMDHSWKSTNPNILNVDENGFSTGINSGIAQIQFLDSVLPSSKINVVEITDLKNYIKNPDKLSNLRNGKSNKPYLFLFEPFYKNEKIDFTTHSFINHNLNINCEIENDDFITKPYQLDNNLLGCYISFKEEPSQLHKNILLTIKLTSLTNKNFYLEKSQRILVNQKIFEKGDKTSQIYLNKSNLKKTIYINSESELEIQTSSKLKQYITTEFDKKKLLTKINIEIPEDLNEIIKERIVLICRSTGEKKIMGFTYEPDSSFLNWFKFSKFSLFDFIAIFICFVISFFVFKELLKRKNGEEKEYYHQKDFSASRFSHNRSFNQSYRG